MWFLCMIVGFFFFFFLIKENLILRVKRLLNNLIYQGLYKYNLLTLGKFVKSLKLQNKIEHLF